MIFVVTNHNFKVCKGKVCHFLSFFFGRHLELHKKYYNLAIENSFNRFLDHINASDIHQNRLSKLINWQDMLNYEFIASSVILMAAILKIGHISNFVPTDHLLTLSLLAVMSPPPPVPGHIV